MRKAQQAAIQGRPYASLLSDVLREVTGTTAQYRHALMETRPVRTTAVVVISTDKGLCGSLNANLFREILRFDPAKTVFIAVGRRAAQFISRTRRRLIAEFTWRETYLLGMARMVSRFVSGLFLTATSTVPSWSILTSSRPCARTASPAFPADQRDGAW